MALFKCWLPDIETIDDAIEVDADAREEAAEAFAMSLIGDGAGFTEILVTVLLVDDDVVNANTYEVYVDYEPTVTAYRRYRVDGKWVRKDEAER